MNRNQQKAVPDFESTLNKVDYLLTSLLEILENGNISEIPNKDFINGAVLLKYDLMAELDAIFEHSLSWVPKVVAHPEETKVFYKTMDQLLAASVIHDHGDKENVVLIHMATALPEISAAAGRNFDENILYFQLRKSDRFVQQQNLQSSKVSNKPVHAWAFKKMLEQGTTGKDQLTGADTFKAGGDE
jgi:hypothetical protein